MGRYAIDLAGRGFAVTGVDQSAELVDIARAKGPRAGGVEFSVANLLSFDPPDRYAAVLCRSVLNDVIADADRATIFCRFAQWLSPGGVLMLDVRDWARSAARYAAGPTGRREIRLPDGAVLASRAKHRSTTRWSREEICRRMAGQFTDLAIRTGYGEHDTAWNDRLVAIATRRKTVSPVRVSEPRMPASAKSRGHRIIFAIDCQETFFSS
jgi:SAM-dependent methyltransferase